MNTIDEVLLKLKEDYLLRTMLKKKNLEIQDELEDEIDDLEQSYITSKVIPELKKCADALLKDLECEMCLAILKDVNGDIRVEDEYVDNIPALFYEDTSETLGVSEDEVEYAGEEEFEVALPGTEFTLISRDNVNDSEKHNLRITVDGKVFQERNVAQTFIKVIQHMGVDNVAKVGIMCSGYNLVDSRRRTDGIHKWQHEVDGKWVYVNLSTPTKCSHIFQIADYYDKNIKIEAINK